MFSSTYTRGGLDKDELPRKLVISLILLCASLASTNRRWNSFIGSNSDSGFFGALGECSSFLFLDLRRASVWSPKYSGPLLLSFFYAIY